MALQVKVLYTVSHPLLTEMIIDTSRLAGSKTSRVNYHVGFEKRPEQIVSDFMALKKRGEAFR